MLALNRAVTIHHNLQVLLIFLHTHPYEIFIPEGTEKLIVGTLPPPRFTTRELREKDVDFCYGSSDGTLWPVLERIYRVRLLYDNSQEAVDQRKDLLRKMKIGICDIVQSCERKNVDASDLGMMKIRMRDILGEIAKCPSISLLIFMGGNTKNGPEFLFRRHLQDRRMKFDCIKETTPKMHRFTYKGRQVGTVSLTSPSSAANRAIGSTAFFKKKKMENPEYSPIDYRVDQYRKIFLA